MISDTLEKTFQNLGLGQNCFLLYQDLIYYPKSSISLRAKRIGVERKLLYLAAEKLLELDLLRIGGKFWSITSLDHLLAKSQSKAQESLNIAASLEKIIPKILYQIDETKKDPIVKYYEGRVQLINAMEEHLLAADSILYSYGNFQLLVDLLGENYIKGWIQRRVAKNIFSKDIICRSAFYITQQAKDLELKREIRFLPDSVKLSSIITMAGNRVDIWNPVVPRAVSIRDEYVLELFLSMFETIWEFV